METSQFTRRFTCSEGAVLELEEVDGLLYPRYHQHLAEQLRRVRHMTLRPSDVILCTFPKAGTHWLWEVLTMLLNNTSDYSAQGKKSVMLENCDLDLVDSQPSPRVLNTHMRPQALPEMTWSRSECRLVVFHRNPKDTVVSLYNMAMEADYDRFRSAFSGSFQGYAELFLKGQMACGSWFDYVRDWEAVRAQLPADRIYVSSYERMRTDPVGEVRKLAAFLGTGTSEALCRDIAEACSFQNLKEASRTVKGSASGPGFWKPNAQGIFRKGEIGDWKNWMSEELSAEFDLAMQSLAELDLSFTYEPLRHTERFLPSPAAYVPLQPAGPTRAADSLPCELSGTDVSSGGNSSGSDTSFFGIYSDSCDVIFTDGNNSPCGDVTEHFRGRDAVADHVCCGALDFHESCEACSDPSEGDVSN